MPPHTSAAAAAAAVLNAPPRCSHRHVHGESALKLAPIEQPKLLQNQQLDTSEHCPHLSPMLVGCCCCCCYCLQPSACSSAHHVHICMSSQLKRLFASFLVATDLQGRRQFSLIC